MHGLRLCVQAEREEFVSGLDSLLKPFSCASHVGVPESVLRIEQGELPKAPPVDGLRRIWSGRLDTGLEVAWFADDDRRVIEVAGLALLRMDMPGRQAHVTVAGGPAWAVEAGCLMPALGEFLGQVGQHLVHAAALTIGGADDGPAVIVCGPSGRGKTTTALAMAHAGMRLMTDDVCFLSLEGDRTAVWGLPRACKVHARTLAMLPWLRELPRHAAPTPNEYCILPNLPFADPRQKHRPQAVVFLDPPNPRGHELSAVDKLTALTWLSRENVRARDTRATGPAGGTFAAVSRLVRHCALYRLSAGPDLTDLADRIRALPGLAS